MTGVSFILSMMVWVGVVAVLVRVLSGRLDFRIRRGRDGRSEP